MNAAFGIDLGTTNSSISWLVGGRPVPIPVGGHPIVPSVVLYRESEIVVGREARNLELSAPGAATKLVADVTARGMWVKKLINNAGFGLRGRFDELPLDRQLEMIDLNIRALTNLAFVVINDMALKGGGSILNVASTAAFQPGPNMGVYFATKAYVLSFTEALHEEWRDRGIKVSALCSRVLKPVKKLLLTVYPTYAPRVL